MLPKKLITSKYILNIRNTEDEKCALWCILAHLFPKYQANRTNANGQQNHRSCDPNVYKEHEKDINTRGIEFPLRISAVGKLEKMNRVAINVFSIDDKANIIPIRISEEHAVSEERIIDLLYIVNGTQSHYCLITKLESLCRSQVTTDIVDACTFAAGKNHSRITWKDVLNTNRKVLCILGRMI